MLVEEQEENKELIERLIDVLDRSYDTFEIDFHYCKSYDVIYFKIRNGFTSNQLKGLFDYVNSDLKKIYEWHINASSWSTVKVNLFLKKEGGYN